jgi:hypothetical protein
LLPDGTKAQISRSGPGNANHHSILSRGPQLYPQLLVCLTLPYDWMTHSQTPLPKQSTYKPAVPTIQALAFSSSYHTYIHIHTLTLSIANHCAHSPTRRRQITASYPKSLEQPCISGPFARPYHRQRGSSHRLDRHYHKQASTSPPSRLIQSRHSLYMSYPCL